MERRRALWGLLVLAWSSGLFGSSRALYRLPTDVEPLHYAVRLEVSDNCTFSGKVAIDIIARNSTDTIELHSNNLTINGASIYFRKGKLPENFLSRFAGGNLIELSELDLSNFNSRKVKELYTNTGKKKNVITIKLEDRLKEGAIYKIELSYSGLMNPSKTLGMYCQPYESNNTVRWLSSSFFEPNFAQRAFPCWDEPEYKAKFTLTVVHPNYTKAISNMPKRTSFRLAVREGWIMDTFYTTPRMPVYLVNVFVGEYASVSTNYTKFKKISAWCPPDKLHMTNHLLHFGAHHLKFFEDHFGIRDPIPKQDFLAIKNLYAGGLENWGLISFRDKMVLLDSETKKSPAYVMSVSHIVAHELAHIWFGNLVTPAWWNDIWLSEGFASFYSMMAVDYLNPQWDFLVRAATRSLIISFNADRRPTTHALAPKELPDRIVDIFDRISYDKGSMIARMLNATLGGKAMREGMIKYLNERLYGSAFEEALWGRLDEAGHAAGTLPANLSLANAMRSWIHVPGHPVVSVHRNYRTGYVTITQTSVLRSKPNRDGWWIPLTYTYESAPPNKVFKLWFDPSVKELVIKDPASPKEWLLFNFEAVGFYRVQYDPRNVQLLKRAVSNGSLSAMGQVGIMLDVVGGVNLAGARQYAVAEALDMARSLGATTHAPAPWSAALASLLPIYRTTEGFPTRSKLEVYMNELIGDEYERVGLVSDEDGLKREWLAKVACTIGLPLCVQHAVDLFTHWRTSREHYDIPEEIRYIVLCTGIRRSGDESAWHMVKERLKYVDDKHYKRDIIQALACTPNKDVLRNYLYWAVDNPLLSGRDTDLLVKAVAEEDISLALELLESNVTLRVYKKESRWQNLLETIALEIRTDGQLRQFRQLLVTKSNFGLKSTITTAGQLAENNLDLTQNTIKEMERWLDSRPNAIDIR